MIPWFGTTFALIKRQINFAVLDRLLFCVLTSELLSKQRNWAEEYPDTLGEMTPEPNDYPSSRRSKTTKEKNGIDDTTSEEEGSSSTLDESAEGSTDGLDPSSKVKIMNFSKLKLLGEQILEFERYKNNNRRVNLYPEEKYDIDATIREWLEHLPTYPDNLLWNFSLQCEPMKDEDRDV